MEKTSAAPRSMRTPVDVTYLTVAVILCTGTAAMIGAYIAGETDISLEDRKGSAYVTSGQCATCHPDHHKSWSRTYHRTMTRPATPENMRAPLDEPVTLSFYGYQVRLERRGDSYFVTLPQPDGGARDYQILYTIGSRRMQQFAVAEGAQIRRIPVFYNIADGTWQHINEAFFRRRTRDPSAFFSGFGNWNANCIFCHNTRPNPGMDYPQWRFSSSVGELGIACEECHAPGDGHARRNRNPLRRYLRRVSDLPDPTMTDPGSLPHQAATQICGQCHGQRMPRPRERIRSLMEHGDPFIAGEDLLAYFEPVTAGSHQIPEVSLRFWPDGSPRLTAYEYQGLVESRCFTASGDLTCTSCHDAHGGDPAGMIEPAMRGDVACTGCHSNLADARASRRHSGHREGSATCYDCHMPRVVYGVQSIHPTHRIRNPDPTRTARFGMPNACNLCHLDRSVNWAIRQTARLWERELAVAGPFFELPELRRGFAMGDVVARTVLLGHAEEIAPPGAEEIYRLALEDPFYIVGHFAERALARRYPEESVDDWAGFLDERGIRIPQELLELATFRRADAPFEFGE